MIALVLVALGSAWSDARAQAWVGDKGSLDVSLDYNFAKSDSVVVDKGSDIPDAGTTTHQITLGAEYVPVNKLAVSVALPFVALKYNGLTGPGYDHPGGGSYDDHDTHTTLQDLRAGLRYQVLAEPLAISPHLAVSVPLADYETVGNSVAGRHLKELHLGVGLGKVFDTETYIHLIYEYSIASKYNAAEDTKKYSQNHSDAGFTVGQKLLASRLDVHADVNLRVTHDGVNFSNFAMLTPDEQKFHDAILKESILLVGGGVGYQLANSFAISLSARAFVKGANTQNANVIALGLAWSPLI